MRVVLAPDSFKESMSADRAARAMAAGVRAVHPDAQCVLRPMADGGEGTLAVCTSAPGWAAVEVPVAGPLGTPVTALLGWHPDRRLALVESAQAVGVHLVPPAERDVLRADSGGVGELLSAALDLGAKRVVIGLGGTVTSDGGAGLLRALGVRLLGPGVVRPGAWGPGAETGVLGPGAATGVLGPGAPLGVTGLDATGLDPRLRRTVLDLACDVRNPLLGPRGAVAVFAPQKGATPAQLPVLESTLTALAPQLDHLRAARLRQDSPRLNGLHTDHDERTPVAALPGAGAAGGLGAALLALGARMRSGASVVAEAIGLPDAIPGADLVLTGEGRVDAQTLEGKVVAGVCQLARAAGVPVAVLGGSVAQDTRLNRLGAVAIRDLGTGLPLLEALRRGPELVEQATADLLRTLPG
ncbi:glycerate kinase [Cellulomonas sp. NPDC089187]|uniref:glycerate kinase n=1 Tax=Cellulomonas sp. NPDC089187 TaxID=3154970 RepID=UPI00343BC8EC